MTSPDNNLTEQARQDIHSFVTTFNLMRNEVSKFIVGQEEIIEKVLVAAVCGGHVLLEGVPGLGKTALVHTIAAVVDLDFNRIQFTPDLLPSDILGTNILIERNGEKVFQFQKGPIFAHIILADEINRATPKTQSALLEAMGEQQVTAEGETRALPEPFFVIATQNPSHQIGTFLLPESQLDRFLMRVELGYPDAQAERALLNGVDRRDLLPTLAPCMQPQDMVLLQREARKVHVSAALLDYLQALVDHSRSSPDYMNGLSPRASLALLNAARAWALMNDRSEVQPEDVQAILPSVVGHRLHPGRDHAPVAGSELGAELIAAVPIP